MDEDEGIVHFLGWSILGSLSIPFGESCFSVTFLNHRKFVQVGKSTQPTGHEQRESNLEYFGIPMLQGLGFKRVDHF